MDRWLLHKGILCMILLFIAASCAHAQGSNNQGVRKAAGSWLDTPDDSLYMAPVFTVECLLRARSGGPIVSRDAVDGTRSDWILSLDHSTRQIVFSTAVDSVEASFAMDTSLEYGRWYHIALVVNGLTGRARLYIDGVPALSAIFSERTFDCVTGLAWGGRFGVPNGGPMDGDFDEARYWNVERTKEQIVAAMARRLDPGERTGLIGYWMFCSNHADSSDTGHDLTPHGNLPITPFPELGPELSCTPVDLKVVPLTGLWVCRNYCYTFRPTIISGVPPYTYYWDYPYVGEEFRTADTFRYCPTRFISLTVRVTDKLGRSASQQFDLTPIQKPVIKVSGPTRICAGREAAFTVTSNVYDAIQTSMSDGSPLHEIIQPTTYVYRPTKPGPAYFRVSITFKGCVTRDSFAVRIDEVLRAEITVDGPSNLCEGDSVTLHGPGAASWLWSTGDTTQRITVHAGGTYTITAIGGNGCAVEVQPVDIVMHPRPPVPVLTRMGDVLSTEAGHAAYRWYHDGVLIAGAAGPSLAVTENGVYTVELVNGFGCTSMSAPYDMVTAIAGVDAAVDAWRIEAWPDPVQGDLTVVLRGLVPGAVHLRVVDVLGRTVHDVRALAGGSSVVVPLAGLPPGVYHIIATGAGTTLHHRIMKQ